MDDAEYRKLAEVEDQMWYFAALHGHLERSLDRLAAAETGRRATSRTSTPGTGDWHGLDAGCGTGGFLRRIRRRRPEWSWTGLDASPLAVNLARERADGPIIGGSVEAVPLPDRSCNAVVSADVLYHVDDDERALAEFFRVLKPGGGVVINVPAYRWLWSYHDVAVHSRRRYGRAEVIAKLTAAGFGEVSTTHWNCLPLPLVVVRRKLLPPPADASDVHLFPPLVEKGFRGLMAVESAWLRRGGSWAAGSSILAVARRPR